MHMAAITLRDRLRSDSRAAHDALDCRMGRFDLTRPAGFGGFLAVHYMAFDMLIPRAPMAGTGPLMSELRARAAADLGVLGLPLPQRAVLPPTPPDPLDPLAVDYTIAGSRLGAQVLRGRWRAAQDPVVRAAGAFFADDDGLPCWQNVRLRATALAATGAEADRVVADTLRVFDLFSGVVDTVSEEYAIHV